MEIQEEGTSIFIKMEGEEVNLIGAELDLHEIMAMMRMISDDSLGICREINMNSNVM